MKRIDYVLNAKDLIKVLVEEFNLALDCCKCPYDDECDGTNCNCREGLRKYLEEDIEVNESNLKDAVVESITIGQTLQSICDIPPQIKINSDKIKETLQETFEKFGDISYLVRITDKYNRICSLLQNGKVEV